MWLNNVTKLNFLNYFPESFAIYSVLPSLNQNQNALSGHENALWQLAAFYPDDLFPAQFVMRRENRMKRRKENNTKWSSVRGDGGIHAAVHSISWSPHFNVAPNEH